MIIVVYKRINTGSSSLLRVEKHYISLIGSPQLPAQYTILQCVFGNSVVVLYLISLPFLVPPDDIHATVANYQCSHADHILLLNGLHRVDLATCPNQTAGIQSANRS